MFFCFFYLQLIKLLSALRLSRQKTNLFSELNGYNIRWKCSFVPRKWAQIAFKAIERKKSAQKKYRSQRQPAWRHVQKKRYVSTTSDVSCSIAER